MTLPEIKDIAAQIDLAGKAARNIAFRLASKITLEEINRRMEAKRVEGRIDYEYIGLLLTMMNRTVIDVKAAIGYRTKEM